MVEMKYLLDVFLGRITSGESKKLSELGNYKLWFGQYRGRNLDAVWKDDPSYLTWFLNLETTACTMTQDRIRTYLKIMQKIQPEKFSTELRETIQTRKVELTQAQRKQRLKKIKQLTLERA